MAVDGKPDPGPRGDLSPEERAALERRSNELGRKLEEARHSGDVEGAKSGGGNAGKNGSAMGRGLKLSGELVAGVVVGGLIGWYLDEWFGNHKKPWFFILFFLLGAAAGMLNLIRGALREKTPPNLPSVKDEQDDNN